MDLSKLPYNESLNLFSLSYRGTRGNLILTFRILNNGLCVNISYHLAPPRTNNMSGHRNKVQKLRSNKLRVGLHFSYRAVNDWNTLPQQVLSAPSVNTFKKKPDHH